MPGQVHRERQMTNTLQTNATLNMYFGLVLLGCSAITFSSVRAADLDAGYGPYPNAEYDRTIERERIYTAPPVERERIYTPAPPIDRRYEAIEERCRIVFERRIDPYGREIVHRIRACDEGPVYSHPSRAYGPGPGGYQPEPYYERSRYRAYPRPPADVGEF